MASILLQNGEENIDSLHILTKFYRMEVFGSLVAGIFFMSQSLMTGVEGALG